MLAFVATEPGAHRRETLAALLWPEIPEQKARRNLSQALYNLRRVIAPVSEAIFEVTARTLQFVPDACFDVDVLHFEQIVRFVDQHPHPYAILCDECRRRLTSAVGLHQGEFLAGLNVADSIVFDDWMRQKRDLLQRKLIEALRLLADSSEKLGDHAAALRHLQHLLEVDPFAEGSCRQSMRLLALSGKRNDALRQYDRFRQMLWDELGVEPEKATQELYRHILAADQPDDALTSQRESTGMPVNTGGSWGDAQIHEVIGEMARTRGQYVSAREAHERALRVCQEAGDRRGTARSLCFLGLTARDTGDFAQAIQLIQQARAIYATLEDRFDAAEADLALARLFFVLGEFSNSISLLNVVVPVYRDLGLQQRVAYLTVALGLTQTLLGQYADARATVSHGLQLSYTVQDRLAICLGMATLGMIAIAEAHYDTAEQLLSQTLVLANAVGRPEELGSVLGSLGYLALRKGSARQAQVHIRDGLRLVQDSHNVVAALCVLPTAALYVKSRGDAEHARELASLCRRFAFFRNSAYFSALYDPHFGEPTTAKRETPETGAAADALWRAADSLIGQI
ncbi:MAG: tetratricopeptide repeat protein [Anaerolineae bacterium]|nr:tetratricopeptide repeat protein [Anaerolineae bacterium]